MSAVTVIQHYTLYAGVEPPRTIGKQRDQFRREIIQERQGIPGRLVATHGITRLGGEFMREAMRVIEAYGLFLIEDDPHGERNVGSFRLWTEQVNWRIDLYDPDLRHGSGECADITKTQRIMTIMLASET